MSVVDHGVIIIGSGVSGLGMGCQLKRKLNYDDFLIIDRAKSIGGTWPDPKDSGYPGCACDIPAPFYSFSFKQVYWKDAWASQAQIHNYLRSVCDDYKLWPHFRLQIEVVEAVWKAKSSLWEVTMRDMASGKTSTATCRVLIGAVGTFQTPRDFDVQGKDRFKGRIVHSGQYDPSLDLTGKDVAVLGNGCSAIQIVPAITPQAKSVTQFVRTKHWILPRPQLDMGIMAYILKHIAAARRVFRTILFFMLEADHRMMHWEKGQGLRSKLMQVSRQHIKQEAPQYYDSLVPNFQLGTKRRIFDTAYIQTLNNAKVNLYEEAVETLEEGGIKRKNGELVPADVIILATGFKVHDYFFPLKVKGVGGKDLRDHVQYKRSQIGYLGCFYAGFPNFSSIMGLATGQGHSSVIFTAECAINMVIKNFAPILKGEVDAVEIKPNAEHDYCQWHRSTMQDMVWAQEKNAKAWYSDDEGNVSALYPGNQISYWWKSITTGSNQFNIKGDRRPLLSRKMLMISALVVAASFLYYSESGRMNATRSLQFMRKQLKMA